MKHPRPLLPPPSPHDATATPFAGVSVANPITLTILSPPTGTPDTYWNKVHLYSLSPTQHKKSPK